MLLWSPFESRLFLSSPLLLRLWQNTAHSCPSCIMLKSSGIYPRLFSHQPGPSPTSWPLERLTHTSLSSFCCHTLCCPQSGLMPLPHHPHPSDLFTRDSPSLDCYLGGWQRPVSQALAWYLALSLQDLEARLCDGLSPAMGGCVIQACDRRCYRARGSEPGENLSLPLQAPLSI